MFNDAPYVSLEDALGLTGSPTNKAISPTDILQRNVDTRSGNFIVRDLYGKIIEIGLQTNGSYNVRFYNSRTGAQIAQFGQNTDNTYALKFLSSTGANIAQFGQQADSTYNLKFFDSSGIGLAQFGQFPDGTLALKVAQAGIEVSTATNAQLVFNSAQNMLKITKTGLLTLSVPDPFPGGTTISGSVAHGLSTRPVSYAWCSVPVTGFSIENELTALPISLYFTGGGLNGTCAINIWISTDDTNMTIKMRNLGAGIVGLGPSWVYRYYIMQETAATT